MSQPVPFQSPIVIEPPDAPAYLAHMGIQVSDVIEAVAAGDTWAGNMTGNHFPVTAAGLARWIYVVGTVRERLSATKLWVPNDPKNRPISQRKDGSYTLSVVGGNEVTGRIDHPGGPSAARKRGRATEEAVKNGAVPLITVEALRALQGTTSTHDSDLRKQPPSGNWFLVYYRDDDAVRVEVSLPRGFDNGQFTGWIVRVILDDWRPESGSARPRDIGGQDVNFDVVEVG
ncbi:hypothetical protein IU474_04275 [Nocardia otitidiscaviarum]|uniref:hypothetical protein n=1 Tax=Nocardia otitidiscaviarum TaxID=1823 RepID=UPI001894B7AC|nr:hypothetical protein [Nocardia otitidiscaviarum]MBF6236295.1 hypothetical protein [Nocardia otitidiscaviarum]